MTKKIEEYQIGNESFLEFVNLNIYDNFDFISDIIEIDLGADLIDEMIGRYWYYSRTFRLRDIEFQLILSDNVGMSLTLLDENKSDMIILRQIADEILKIIKERSGRYKPVRRKPIRRRLVRTCTKCGSTISKILFEKTKGLCKECEKEEAKHEKFKKSIIIGSLLLIIFIVLLTIILYFQI
ncbi:MAG: hypothetical protein GF311_25115 [Candidatus Lokiarchaeota archaeon]|nr:hypothetical protein [Candidatus Lokiarchaeota archaeon]